MIAITINANLNIMKKVNYKENKYMKLVMHKWNISEAGKNKPTLYYGFKTKREAQAFVDNWNKTHELKIEVIKY